VETLPNYKIAMDVMVTKLKSLQEIWEYLFSKYRCPAMNATQQVKYLLKNLNVLNVRETKCLKALKRYWFRYPRVSLLSIL
jgi:hypothetical protein